MRDETIVKYIKGELEDEEKQGVINWIASSEENQKRYSLLKAQHTASGFNTPGLDTEKTYGQWKKHTQMRRLKRVFLQLTSAAAAFAVGWFMVDMFTSPGAERDAISIEQGNVVEEITPKGVSREIALPDGSRVMLNVDSKLSYLGAFTGKIREVFLTGEAYFEVARDTSRPFIVHAGDMNVKVLGTSFNVRSYLDDSRTGATLVNGSVEVGSEYTEAVTLKPLQTALFNREDRHLEVKKVSREEAVSWKEGKLIFRETPLEDVLEDLERKYDVSFEIRSEGLYDYLFTGTFDNLTIDEVLRVLKISSPIDYKKEKGKITLY